MYLGVNYSCARKRTAEVRWEPSAPGVEHRTAQPHGSGPCLIPCWPEYLVAGCVSVTMAQDIKEYGEIIFFFSARETCQASTATELHLQPSPKHFILAVLEFELGFVLA